MAATPVAPVALLVAPSWSAATSGFAWAEWPAVAMELVESVALGRPIVPAVEA